MEDDAVDRLYELDLGEFITERDALAKQLKADGDADGAKAVKALAKPSRAAWAVNVVVRAEPQAVEAFTEAADALAQAQEDALAGGDAKAMRGAMEDVRGAIGALLEHLPEGESESTRDAVGQTLQAAVIDPDAREQVLAARLDRELEPAGFGGAGSAAPRARGTGARKAAAKPEPKAEPKAKAKPKGKAKAKPEADDRADAAAERKRRREARKQAEAAIADTRKALTAARKAVTAAGKERDAAEKAQERTQAELDKARQALEAAEAAHDEADRRAQDAAAELDARTGEVDELETALDRAQEQLDAAD